MGFLALKKSNDLCKSFACLLQVIKEDKEINNRVIQLLKLNSFTRRLLLNKWLEQLRRKNAPEQLTKTLLCLFDDVIAQKVFTLINRIEK